MIAQVPNLDTILKRHKIHPKFWPEIRAARRRGRAAQRRTADPLESCRQLSGGGEGHPRSHCPSDHEFPPADYQSPVPYESLLVDDIESEDACL